MADCGIGEFLWIRRCTDPEGYMANSASLMDDEHRAMSKELFGDFRKWATRYMHWDREQHQREMDWESFNVEGQQLAVRLEAEVGPLVKVRYCRAYPDPYDGPDRCVEIPHEGRTFRRGVRGDSR
jgi:hypothetical protein